MRFHLFLLASMAIALCLLCMWISPGVATTYLLCPPVESGVIKETCLPECYGDRHCQGKTGLNTSLCCPSPSCGQQCAAGLTAPHHSPVQLCPEPDPDTVGLCAEFCSGDSDCSGENQLCCSNGCGHSCSAAAPVCESILRSRNRTFRTGEYVPECSEDGRFALAQCHGSTGYCWCVRPETGEPVGRSMVRFSQPECNNCSYNGQVYYPGDSFKDNCTACRCHEDGSLNCNENGCTCYSAEDGRTYHERDVVRRYYDEECSKEVCLKGEFVIVKGCAPCEFDGNTYQHGEHFGDECLPCTCDDGFFACIADACGFGYDLPDRHLTLLQVIFTVVGTLIAVVACIGITTLVVMVVLIKRGHLHRKKQPVASVSLSLQPEAQILLKNGLPGAESVEFKVPVEDKDEPVKT